MIKGKSPFPFETIVLAVAFTPDTAVLISEMKRLCELHKAIAVFIHVGKKTGDKQRELALLLNINGFHDGNSRIYWEQGEAVSCILKICKHEVADLLISGASERENFALPIGQVATGIATKAKCSVLIYAESPVGGFKKIVVNGIEHKKTDLTVLTSLYVASKENVASILITDEESTNSDNEANNSFSPSVIKTVSPVIHETLNKSKVKLNYFSLPNEHCETISEYAFKNNADLIVTHSSEHHLLIFDRIVNSRGIESLLKSLPCNLLIVHARLPE